MDFDTTDIASTYDVLAIMGRSFSTSTWTVQLVSKLR